MIALLMAPLLKDKEDWEDFWMGIIPLFICLAITAALMKMEILTWKDPLDMTHGEILTPQTH